MMRKKVAQRILENSVDSNPILSVYVDTDRSRKAPKQILIDLKNQKKEAYELLSAWPGTVQEALLGAFDEITDKITGTLSNELPRGWAFFLSPQKRVFESSRLPDPVLPSVSIARRPKLSPLIQSFGPFRELLVVVIGGKWTRFFVNRPGFVELLWEMGEELPKKSKDSGWMGLEEGHRERRVEEWTQRYIKDVAARSKELLGKHPSVEGMVVGGNRELSDIAIEFLKGQIPLPVSFFEAPPETATADELAKAVEEFLMKRFWEEGEELVQRILNEAFKQDLSARGWRSVLAACNRGAIHQLLIEEYEAVKGRFCPHCKALGLDEDECPLCGSRMDEEPDLMEALIAQTLGKDGEVILLGRPSSLHPDEGLGALLRFPL